MKAALYVRVSTDEQVKEGFSINAQRQRLKEFIKSQGWKLYKEYVDEGFSAKNLERPAMQSMISDVKKEKFDVVLVYRLDRMVRSVLDLHELLKLFDNHHVTFKSATEMFDTTSAMGRFFITLVGAMAAWERENLAERVVMGMKRSVEEGNRPGGTAPFGYDLVDGHLIINQHQAKWVKYIFDNYKLKGGREISKYLNDNGIKNGKGKKWWPTYIVRMVSNPVYYGAIRWNYDSNNKEIIVDGDHEPIISKELFDEIQSVKSDRKKERSKGDSVYPFTHVLHCARCGSHMVGNKHKKYNSKEFYRYYICHDRFRFGTCDMPMVNEEIVVHEFLNNLELRQVILNLEPQEDNTEELRKELNRIVNAKENTRKMFQWGDISENEYRNEMDKLSKREMEINEQLDNAPTPLNIDAVNDKLLKAKKTWPYLTDEQRKGFVRSLVSSLTVELVKTGKRGQQQVISIVDVELK